MTFITGYHDKRQGKVLVWEKSPSGQRVRTLHNPPYYFYVADDAGDRMTITGQAVKRVSCRTADDFDAEIAEYTLRRVPVFESDLNPLERVLMDIYSKKEVPQLIIGLLDIEVDYDPDIGFANSTNAYAPINAVTVYISDKEEYTTVAVPPKSWDWSQPFPDLGTTVILVKNERELLERLLDLIHRCDVVSGWNSEFFDMPYIARRVELILGDAGFARLAFEGGPPPRWTEKARFKHAKEKEVVIDLVTRVHLDYLLLFAKFDLTKRQSYSLDNVSFEELGENKVEYDGSLHELYNNDFVKFVVYNIHDVRLIVRLDAKFRYIELANQMVHMASVNFSQVFGSVNLIDTAIMTFAHNELNLIVTDKVTRPEADAVEGAIVVTPHVGFYRWIGACDINSLYPSTIRSLNLAIEKMIGQLQRPVWPQPGLFGVSWQRNDEGEAIKLTEFEDADYTVARYGFEEGRECYDRYEACFVAVQRAMNNPDDQAAQEFKLELTLDGDRSTLVMSAGELVAILKENCFAVSGYGTLIDQSSGMGLVPTVLTAWFKGRKELQAEKKKYGKLKAKLLAEGRSEADPEVLEATRLATYYDMLQGVRKVLLNSTYGALLNEYSRFGDPRLGASVTYTGRQITTHMINTVSESLTTQALAPKLVKHFNIEGKTDSGNGEKGHNLRQGRNEYEVAIEPKLGPIYGDTDSVYFTYEGLIDANVSIDEAVEIANQVADRVNESFPDFMRSAFNCQPSYDDLIKANRELVCRTGLIQAKKKYMMLVVDKEGKRIKPGDDDELKTMGSDIRLSSTPELIRELLKAVVMMLLNEQPKEDIDEIIMAFRDEMGKATSSINPLDLATVVSVNNFDQAWTLWDRMERSGLQKKVKIPPNARSAVNHNYMLEHFNVKEIAPIKSGKIKIVWLRDNQFGFKNIAFASETETLPKWFTDNFEVDTKLMEQKLVDQKLELIFKSMSWEVPTAQSRIINNLLDF